MAPRWGLMTGAGPLINGNRKRPLVDFAAKNRLPAMYRMSMSTPAGSAATRELYRFMPARRNIRGQDFERR